MQQDCKSFCLIEDDVVWSAAGRDACQNMRLAGAPAAKKVLG